MAVGAPLLMVFDLLYWYRRDLTGRALRDRRARLEDIVAGPKLVFPVRRLAPDGPEAWAQVMERGYEGHVAKDEASLYEGGPTRRWLKVKQKGLGSRGGRLAAADLAGSLIVADILPRGRATVTRQSGRTSERLKYFRSLHPAPPLLTFRGGVIL